jgi:hypothetical protein
MIGGKPGGMVNKSVIVFLNLLLFIANGGAAELPVQDDSAKAVQ